MAPPRGGRGTAVQELAVHYAQVGLYVDPGSLPGAHVAAWITEWIWIPYMALVALVIPMLYPMGRLLARGGPARGRSGRLLDRGACFALAPGNLGGYPEIPNPVAVDGAGWIRNTAMR